MPAQRTLFGRLVALPLPPRRFVFVFALALALVLLIALSSLQQVRDAAPVVSKVSHSLSEQAHHAVDKISIPHMPKLYNPLAEAAHEPPDQEHSHRAGVRWYSDLKWLNPFSSSVTLDQHRALLPPLPPRAPIYTFYERSKAQEKDVLEAENDLILTWRRAWWARGFRPVVLGRAEAIRHPLHERMSRLELEKSVVRELERWMAWAHMGGGVMSNWLVLPMGTHDQELFALLRSDTFDRLLKFESIKDGLYAGGKDHIDALLTQLVDDKSLTKATDLPSVLPDKAFSTETRTDGLAYYDLATIKAQYPAVADQLASSKSAGLAALRRLINSHLHDAWASAFSDGVSVLRPGPKHMNIVTVPARKIAHSLASCSSSPVASSCPPNRPTCTPCSPQKTMRVTYSDSFENRSSVFTVGTIPHPVTFTSLHYNSDTLDARFVRRSTTRDLWIQRATQHTLGKKLSGPQRLVQFKATTVSDYGLAVSFWMTAEREEFNDLDWIFGFELPATKLTDHDLLQPVRIGAGPDDLEDKTTPVHLVDSDGNMRPTDAGLDRERTLIDLARTTLAGKARDAQPAVDRVEAWSMADTEAWNFVKAFNQRRQLERERWEADERKFMGSRPKAAGPGSGILG